MTPQPRDTPDPDDLRPETARQLEGLRGQLTRRLAAKRLEGKAAAYGEAIDLLTSLADDPDTTRADAEAALGTLRQRKARAMHIRHKLEQRYAQRARDGRTGTETPTTPHED